MPTPTKGPRLGGGPAHERIMLANLSANLFEHKSITTTVTKAKRLRPFAERLITHAKKGDLASRRKVQGIISAKNRTNKTIVHELFTVIAPAMANREGGYTRITKIGNRQGDNAPMAVIELVMEPVSPKQAVVKEAETATETAAPAAPAEDVQATAQTQETAETPVTETPAAEAQTPEQSAEAQAAQDTAAEAADNQASNVETTENQNK